MNNKYVVDTLVKLLQEKFGLEKDNAEIFVEKFFEVLLSGLEQDRLVKIKGLGSFKLSKVSARESIDVNTGERIVLEARDKITFLPENSLKDLINKPFSHFETVVLNDGVSFDELETSSIEGEESNNDSSTDKENTDQSNNDQNNSETEGNIEERVIPEQMIRASSTTKENVEPADVPNESAEKESFQNASGVEVEIKKGEQALRISKDDLVILNSSKVDDDKILPNSTQPKEKNQDEVSSDKEKFDKLISRCQLLENQFDSLLLENKKYKEENELLKKSMSRNRNVFILSILCFILLLGLAICGYFLWEKQNIIGQEISTSSVIPQKEMDSIRTEKDKPSTAVPTPLSLRDSVMLKNKKVNCKEDSSKKTSQESLPKIKENVGVKTGAYKIIGIADSVKLRSGQTLKSISNFYLGEGMECYIEAVNGGRKDFKVGENIYIPKLQIKHKKNR